MKKQTKRKTKAQQAVALLKEIQEEKTSLEGKEVKISTLQPAEQIVAAAEILVYGAPVNNHNTPPPEEFKLIKMKE